MRGVVIFSVAGDVVFHTAPCSREFVDNVVSSVESDILVKVGYCSESQNGAPQQLPAGRTDTDSARAGRNASSLRHGGYVPSMSSANTKALKCILGVVDGTVVFFSREHHWLEAIPGSTVLHEDINASTTPSRPGYERASAECSCVPTPIEATEPCILLYWRRVKDKVIVFALEERENLATAKLAMSNFVVLLAEAFKGGKASELPSLKDILARPELVQMAMNAVTPQHVLALVDLPVARHVLMSQLKGK